MLSSSPSPIVVGRTLSSYFVGGIQNNQETITYTVYSQDGDPETGVLLTTTLEPGVTFASASQQPNMSGQNLAWSLGTIDSNDRASVSVTVNLPSPTPAQLDSGAQAFAFVDGAAVTGSTPAATLSPGTVDPSLLASTPDANTNDPVIQEAAAALNYNPQTIFTFLQEAIGYNAYAGSMRGARGTLWSLAGNALDDASLGVALMRASGIPAQYVSGTLSKSNAQSLILSMFPANYQLSGYLPAGTTVSDPADDAQLLSETESHYWLQFNTGGGMEDADPLMPGATLGKTFTTAASTFSVVPDNLEEKTEISLTAEIYDQGAAVLGLSNGLTESVVLDQTFDDVALVGHPITIGNFVSSATAGGLTIQSTTNTYSPYIAIGDVANPDPEQDNLISGQNYQEVLTNFPLASQVVTGLFLNVTLSGPEGPAKTYNTALVDNIGYNVRQNGGSVNVTSDPDQPPSIDPDKIWSMSVLAGSINPAYAQSVANHAADQYDRLSAQVASGNTDSAPIEADLSDVLIAQSRAYLLAILATSDFYTAYLAHDALVEAYFVRPRITLVSAAIATDDSGTTTLSFEANLLEDSIHAIADPGQDLSALAPFQIARGLFEDVIETNVFPDVGSTSSLQVAPVVSTTSVLAAAQAEGIEVVTINPDDVGLLDSLDIDALAKARIASALQAGMVVTVPTQDVKIGSRMTTAWFELNPITNELVGVDEDGNHGADYFADIEVTQLVAKHVLLKTSAALASQLIFSQLKSNYNIYVQNNYISLMESARNALGIGIVFFLGTIKLTAKRIAIETLHRDVSAAVDARSPTAYEADISARLNVLIDDFARSAVNSDPPVEPNLLADPVPFLSLGVNELAVGVPHGFSAGDVTGLATTQSLAVAGPLSASWTTADTSSFNAQDLNVAGATVTAAGGAIIGSGSVSLTASATELAISGNVSYDASGQGSLSFYGPAESTLGVSGDWTSYSATATGTLTIVVTTSGLTLNGSPLPAGTYTITTAAAMLNGSGATTSPDFSGSATITASSDTVNLGPATGSLTVGAAPIDPTEGATLDGYTGTITVAANGDGTDSIMLGGTTTNVLSVVPNSNALTTDPNTPLTFAVNLQTSLADTYDVNANPPPGWTATVDGDGNVTITPALGVTPGTYPVQIIVQSETDPNLIAQSVVDVTITPSARASHSQSSKTLFRLSRLTALRSPRPSWRRSRIWGRPLTRTTSLSRTSQRVSRWSRVAPASRCRPEPPV